MSKIVYIIPGFSENTNLRGYQQIMKFFKSRHFKVIPIKISWKNNTMSEYVGEFLSQARHKAKDKIYVLGFSFGAMIALITAINLKPKELFLCSLSPYFKEDLPFLKKSWIARESRRRLADLKNISFNQLAAKIKARTLLLVGEKEPVEVLKRVKAAAIKIINSKMIIISKAKHEISGEAYLKKLKEIINSEL